MTVGTKGNHQATVYGPAPKYFKSWSGDDGRTEVISGSPRAKWNNYTCIIVDRLSDKVAPGMGRPGCGFPNAVSWYEANSPYKNQELKLQGRLVAKIREHEFNLGVELAQGKQTMGMVYSSLSKVTRAFRHVKRGRIGQAARVLGVQGHRTKLSKKDVSGNWLELQYGWLPFLSSTKEAMDAYASINRKRKSTVRASIKYGWSLDGSQSPSFYSCIGQVTVRKRIIYEVSETPSVSRELGLLDPASIAWELMPWSFVVDWFIPIGSFLENLNMIPSLTGRSCTTTLVTVVMPRIGVLHPIWNGGALNFRQTMLERRVGVGVTLALPQFVKLGNVLSPVRFANAIALAHQRFK